MKVNNSKKTIPYAGLGLVFGGILGFFIGIIVKLHNFALLGGIGSTFGLVVGAIIDALIKGGDKKDD